MNRTELRERFAATRKTRRELVTLNLDGESLTVAVRGMTAGVRNELVKASQITITDEDGNVSTTQDAPRLAMLMVIKSVCVPETDELLFDDRDVSIIEALPAGEVDRIAEVAAKLSGIGKAAHDAAAGNSNATPADASRSA